MGLYLLVKMISSDQFIDRNISLRFLIREVPLEAIVSAVKVIGGKKVGNCDFLVEGLLSESEHNILCDFGAGSDDNQTHHDIIIQSKGRNTSP